MMTSEDVPRVVDLMFEANARAREIARRLGTRSEEYELILDEVKSLREIHREERLVRQPPLRGQSLVQRTRRGAWTKGRPERSP